MHPFFLSQQENCIWAHPLAGKVPPSQAYGLTIDLSSLYHEVSKGDVSHFLLLALFLTLDICDLFSLPMTWHAHIHL